MDRLIYTAASGARALMQRQDSLTHNLANANTPGFRADEVAFRAVPVRGEGCRVWDADGKVYLDFLAGVAVNNLGHCHPKVVKAIREQAATLIHCSNYYQIPTQIELAELLCSHSFADKAFFCNSGAEANEAAIKLARKYSRDTFGPERYEIITAADSFHGRTMATVSATSLAAVISSS